MNNWTTGEEGAVLCSRRQEGGGGCAGDCKSPVRSRFDQGSAPLQNNKVFWRKNIFVLFKYIGGIS